MRSRTAAAAIVLVACALVVPLLGVSIANGVRPVVPAALVPLPPEPAFPPMPAAPATTQAIADAFEPLPLVDPGTDAADPRPFLTLYREADADDPAAMARLVGAAIAEIRVKSSGRAVTDEFLSYLLQGPPAGGEGEVGADDEVDDTDESSDFESEAFMALARKAMTHISATPANAEALNDLVIAMFGLSQSSNAEEDPPTLDGEPFSDQRALIAAATKAFELGIGSFPDNRSMAVNLALLRSLDSSPDEGAGDPAVLLQAYLSGHPTDVTARSLLADVVAQDPERGVDLATASVEPLLSDPSTELAGRLLLADTLLTAADVRHESSPFAARDLATKALREYDRVIAGSGDPAAYTGRALTLELLGQPGAASEAQQAAIDAGDATYDAALRQAALLACDGQYPASLDAARKALELAGRPGAPTLADRGFSGLFPPGTSGGGFAVKLEAFPESGRCLTDDLPGDRIGAAASRGWIAAMAIDDRQAANDVVEAWAAADAFGADGPAADDPEEEESEGIGPAADLAAVMKLLDGTALGPDDEDPRDGFVDFARELPPEMAGRLCATLTNAGPDRDSDAGMVRCAAEAAYRGGDPNAAARLMEPLVRTDAGAPAAEADRYLEAGTLEELADRPDRARKMYEAAATHSSTSIAGLTRLGDLDLSEGDATGALDHYVLASTAIRTAQFGDDETELTAEDAAAIRQGIDNNRGVALLMTTRTEPDVPPDCGTFRRVCNEAAEAFAAAAAEDPLNPVYAMNQAWVARLTGDEDRARDKLEEAVRNGTPLLAAAHNDLGVLAARRGDVDAARSAFREAIAAEPEYDLATWNLGVLESRLAGAGLVGGQALLADATALNHELLTTEVAFKFDDRVYRIEVSDIGTEVARAPGTGAAVGAAAFGAIAVVGAIAQLISNVGSDVQSAAGTVGTEVLARGGRQVRRRGGALRIGGQRWPSWAAWIPAIVVLTVTTSWTAAWMAPDAVVTATLIGLAAAALAMGVHACGHLVAAGFLGGGSIRPAGWTPGIALAIVGMPFHVPAGPFLAEGIATGDARRDWWLSFAGILANLAAAGIALLIYLAAPMPFLRILVATQLAVAAFSLIPSDPLDGDRLSSRPIILALVGLAVAAASAAIAVGAV